MSESKNSKRSVLVIDSRTEVFEVVQNILESEENIDLIYTTSSLEAQEIIDENPGIQMIFASYELKDGNTGNLFVKNYNLNNIPFFFISGTPKSEMEGIKDFGKNKLNQIIQRPPEESAISEAIYSVLKSDIKKLYDSGDTNVAKLGEVYLYIIKIDTFIKRKKTYSNVFVKLNNEKLVKVANAGEEIDPDRFKNYQNKGLTNVYLSREEYNNYVEGTFNKLKKALGNKDAKPSEQLKTQMRAIDQVQDIIKTLGLTKETVVMCEKITESLINTIQKNKDILPFLQKMIQKDNYFSEHTNIMAYIITAICVSIDWNTMATIEKMIRATIFADAAFAYDQESLAMVHSKEEANYKDLPLLERKIIDKHMADANILIEAAGDFLTDEPMLISNHHERPDGSGYPAGLDKNNTPQMSAAFNIAYTFSHHLVMADDPSMVDPKEILEIMGEDYSKGNYRKPYTALKKALRIK